MADFCVQEALLVIEPIAQRLWRVWRGHQQVFGLDDLRQAGFLGVLKGFRAFGDGNPESFPVYAWKAARGEMVLLIKSCSAVAGRGIRRGKIRPMLPLLVDVIEVTQEPAEPPNIEAHLGILSKVYRDTIESHFGIGRPRLSYRKLAQSEAIPISTSRARYVRGMAKMRRAALISQGLKTPKLITQGFGK